MGLGFIGLNIYISILIVLQNTSENIETKNFLLKSIHIFGNTTFESLVFIVVSKTIKILACSYCYIHLYFYWK